MADRSRDERRYSSCALIQQVDVAKICGDRRTGAIIVLALLDGVHEADIALESPLAFAYIMA